MTKLEKANSIHDRLRRQAFVAYQLPMSESERRPVVGMIKILENNIALDCSGDVYSDCLGSRNSTERIFFGIKSNHRVPPLSCERNRTLQRDPRHITPKGAKLFVDQEKLQKHFDQIELARLFTDLADCRRLIRDGIIPNCQHFAPEETNEMCQALELAASAIDEHLKSYKLTVAVVRRERDEKR